MQKPETRKTNKTEQEKRKVKNFPLPAKIQCCFLKPQNRKSTKNQQEYSQPIATPKINIFRNWKGRTKKSTSQNKEKKF